ncbi:tRNA adenosine(34) deaminase TadA [Aliidiomarina sp. Khilg15.8]
MSNSHEFYMQQALALADEAEAMGEVPVGALVVYEDRVIGRGFNQVITQADPSAHAEMLALREAAGYLRNYRLLDTTLYVTLEPCPMCAGLLVHGRVQRLVFGAADPKTGACGSVLNLTQHAAANHQLEVEGGVLQEVCAEKLSAFFKRRRAAKKALKQAARNYSASS